MELRVSRRTTIGCALVAIVALTILGSATAEPRARATTAADRAVAALSPRATRPASVHAASATPTIRACVRIEGKLKGERGTVRIIRPFPTDVNWKEHKRPVDCEKNEQELDWTERGESVQSGAAGPGSP